jgi:hypothetical protein
MTVVTDNAVVAGNNLLSFSGVSRTHRTDILDLLMYADHFATQTWRRDAQWTSWIEYYRKQFSYSGCQLKSQIVKPAMVISSASELDDISFGVTGSVRVSGLMDLARRSFKEARLNEYARHFFESGSDSGYLSSFQVVPCEGIGADDVSILICGLHARATVSSESRGGDWRLNREMVVRLAGGVYHFNAEAYAPHRQRIQSRLQEVGRFNIQHLNI